MCIDYIIHCIFLQHEDRLCCDVSLLWAISFRKVEAVVNLICPRNFFFQFVHHPYPIVEVLMFPASGVGLEADGC